MRHMVNFLSRLRARRGVPPGGYGPEVLFAGWVDLPEAFRQPAAGRAAAAPRASHNFTRSR